MLNWHRCLVSLCCRHRKRKAAFVVSEHPCNVFLPSAVARDHAIEMAYAAAESAQLSAANAQRAVNQLVELRKSAKFVFQQAADAARKELKVATPNKNFNDFTLFEMTRVSRELVRSNSA